VYSAFPFGNSLYTLDPRQGKLPAKLRIVAWDFLLLI
jgi:hypothetical protein